MGRNYNKTNNLDLQKQQNKNIGENLNKIQDNPKFSISKIPSDQALTPLQMLILTMAISQSFIIPVGAKKLTTSSNSLLDKNSIALLPMVPGGANMYANELNRLGVKIGTIDPKEEIKGYGAFLSNTKSLSI